MPLPSLSTTLPLKSSPAPPLMVSSRRYLSAPESGVEQVLQSQPTVFEHLAHEEKAIDDSTVAAGAQAALVAAMHAEARPYLSDAGIDDERALPAGLAVFGLERAVDVHTPFGPYRTKYGRGATAASARAASSLNVAPYWAAQTVRLRASSKPWMRGRGCRISGTNVSRFRNCPSNFRASRSAPGVHEG